MGIDYNKLSDTETVKLRTIFRRCRKHEKIAIFKSFLKTFLVSFILITIWWGLTFGLNTIFGIFSPSWSLDWSWIDNNFIFGKTGFIIAIIYLAFISLSFLDIDWYLRNRILFLKLPIYRFKNFILITIIILGIGFLIPFFELKFGNIVYFLIAWIGISYWLFLMRLESHKIFKQAYKREFPKEFEAEFPNYNPDRDW